MTYEEVLQERKDCEEGNNECSDCKIYNEGCSCVRVVLEHEKQAVREFAERLKQALFVNCTIIRRADDSIEEDMKSEEVNDTIDLLLAEVTGE